MANTTVKLVDSGKRLVLKIVSDNVEGARILKLDAGSLYGAMNANNMLLLSNGTDRKAKYRLALKNAWYDIGGGAGAIVLSTDGDAGVNSIVTFSGQGTFSPTMMGDPFTIDFGAAANTTGNVWLNTLGVAAANGPFSLILDFRKHPEDYSQGQFEDPTAFNRSPRGVNG